jgi:hypothetical protein
MQGDFFLPQGYCTSEYLVLIELPKDINAYRIVV